MKYGINNRFVRLVRYVFHETIGLEVYPDIKKKAAIKKLPRYIDHNNVLYGYKR